MSYGHKDKQEHGWVSLQLAIRTIRQVVKRQTCISVLGTKPAAAAAPGSAVSDSQFLVSSSSADPGLLHSRSSVVEVAQTEMVQLLQIVMS